MNQVFQRWRAICRLLRFASLIGVNLRKISSFHWQTNESHFDFVIKNRKLLSSRLIHMLGLKVKITGIPPKGQNIFVGNHRSYLDPLFVIKDHDCIPVSKAEMKGWPIIGKYSDKSGTLFVMREDPNNRFQILLQIKKVLEKGHSILIYPEGTSHSKSHTIQFNKSIFSIAAKHQVPIVPVITEYEQQRMHFIDDDTFISHFIKNFYFKENKVFVHFVKPVLTNNPDELMTMVSTAIDQHITRLQKQI